ncbi:MAG: MerR family transcriptional regulator [Chloroflexota bacterium]
MTALRDDNAEDQTRGRMGIAELAARAGVTPRTIRYYVAEGLLPSPGGRGQHRAYREEHLQQLDQIRQMKAAYLPLHEIRRRLDTPATTSAPLTTALGTTLIPADSASSGSQPVAVATQVAVATTGARPSATEARLPMGFGQQPNVGRIEIYDPPETVWRRHVLAPGVELHYRQTDDPKLAEAIQRLLREAAAILDADRPTL